MQQDNDTTTAPFTEEFAQQYNRALAEYREHCVRAGLQPKNPMPDRCDVSIIFNLRDDNECFAFIWMNPDGSLSIDLRDDVCGVSRHEKLKRPHL